MIGKRIKITEGVHKGKTGVVLRESQLDSKRYSVKLDDSIWTYSIKKENLKVIE